MDKKVIDAIVNAVLNKTAEKEFNELQGNNSNLEDILAEIFANEFLNNMPKNATNDFICGVKFAFECLNSKSEIKTITHNNIKTKTINDMKEIINCIEKEEDFKDYLPILSTCILNLSACRSAITAENLITTQINKVIEKLNKL